MLSTECKDESAGAPTVDLEGLYRVAMSATQELVEAVRARARGTSYAVEPTAQGFDVRLALEDPQ